MLIICSCCGVSCDSTESVSCAAAAAAAVVNVNNHNCDRDNYHQVCEVDGYEMNSDSLPERALMSGHACVCVCQVKCACASSCRQSPWHQWSQLLWGG